MDQTKRNNVEVKVDKPVQLSIWDILEHPLFEKNLTEEMKLLSFTGQNYTELKEKVMQQYQRDMETLELAKDNQMKELLKDYPKPEDLTVKYVEVITKKSALGTHKRELIESIFSRIVKATAIDIINQKTNDEKCNSQKSSSQKPHAQA